METYKHSCPFCGQHVEYTVGYCGKQMACPICGKTITFPAIPPGGKGPKLHLKRAEPESSFQWKWPFDLAAKLAFLGRFKQWNLALTCLVPFLIIVGLLVGAHWIRKHFGDEPSMPAVPAAQADPSAWQKMTDLARADQDVQAKLALVRQAQANLNTKKQYHAEPQAVAAAQNAVSAATRAFETSFQNYQQLGGQVDYRSQLPPQ
jgi:hypothetical protein